MVLLFVFATYSCDPSGLIATPHGWVPTLTALATVLVAVLIADRVDALLFATYNMVPSRDMANTQRSTPDTDGLGNGQ